MENKRSLYKLSEKAKNTMESGLANLAIHTRNTGETNNNKITSYFQDMAGNTFSTTNWLCGDYPKQNNIELRNPEKTNKNKITHYFQDVAGNKIYKKIEFNAE